MSDLDDLLERTAAGDIKARSELFDSQIGLLLRYVTGRLDPMLSARVDPADIVQEAMMEASERLDVFLATRPMPFTRWLLQIAEDEVIDTHRRHTSQSRNVDLEVHATGITESGIAGDLITLIAAPGKSPSSFVGRKELREKVQAILASLPEGDRQVLRMRFIEQLRIREIAAELGITEDAARMRQLRAIERLRDRLEIDF